MKAEANQLFEEIQFQELDLETDDLILLIEIGANNVDAISLQYTSFGTFALRTRHPRQRIQSTEQRIANDFAQLLEKQLRIGTNHRIAFVMGELANANGLEAVFKEKLRISDCFWVDLFSHTGEATEMPSLEEIRNHLAKQVGTARHSLEIATLTYPGTFEDRRRPSLKLGYKEVYPYGTAVDSLSRFPEVKLYAPLPGQEIDVYFREMPQNAQIPSRVVVYRIIPLETEFYCLISFDGKSWKAEWDGARLVNDPETLPNASEIPTATRVNVREMAPRVLFVVEAALGMKRLLNTGLDLETVMQKETDFAIVRDFVKEIISTLRISKAEYSIMFYNDYHKEQSIPFEFKNRKKGSLRFFVPKSEDEIISFLPQADNLNPMQPVFTDYENILERIDQDFMDKQSVTSDWYKSLEWAAHTVNQIDWQGAEHIVLWIGQSSPHHFPVLGQYFIGFEAKHNFMQEISQSWDKSNPRHSRHIAFFISADIPLENLRREARGYWKQIGRETHTYELQLAAKEDLQSRKMEDEVFGMLEDLSRDLQTSQIIEIIPGDNNRIDLPFDFLPHNARIVVL